MLLSTLMLIVTFASAIYLFKKSMNNSDSISWISMIFGIIWIIISILQIILHIDAFETRSGGANIGYGVGMSFILFIIVIFGLINIGYFFIINYLKEKKDTIDKN